LQSKTDFLMPVDDAISAVNVIEAIMESYQRNEPVEVKKL
jgi:hypothetical protein